MRGLTKGGIMALLEDGIKGLGSSLLVGVGAVIAAPIVIPAIMGGLRPLAKTAIKGYLFLSDSLRESLSEAGEQMSDLVAEVRAEAETAASGSNVADTSGEPSARMDESHAHAEGEARKGRRKEP